MVESKKHSVLPGSFLFPVGTATDYTPARLTVSSATTFGTVRLSPVTARHPLAQGTNNALTYYWDVKQAGFTNATTSQTFTYAQSDVQGTEVDYISARYDGAWTTGTVTDVNEGTNIITFSGTNIIEGAFTAGEVPAFPAPTTYYSRQTGDWSDVNSWSTVSHAGAVAGTIPTANDKVIVGDGDVISATANGHESGTINIVLGSRLDIGGFIGHNFGDYEGIVGEEGELRISIDQTINNGTAVFPGGDWGEFLDADGGTVEYYEPRNNGNSSLELPANIATYYNLRIDNNREE